VIEKALRRAWRDFIHDEEATKQRFQKRLERLLRRAGFASRGQLVRHLKKKQIAATNRARYTERKLAGLCVWCPEPPKPALPGRVHCLEHAKMNARSAADRRMVRRP
jgi:hypothetical protein